MTIVLPIVFIIIIKRIILVYYFSLVVLVLGRSHEINMRRIYNDSCIHGEDESIKW